MARCTVVTARGACKMAALKGSTPAVCFAHSPAAAAARSAARRRGGAKRNGETRPADAEPGPASVSPAPLAFELGELRDRRDVGPALLRLARAIARGLVDPRRGRLLTEALRAASFAFAESGGGGESLKRGWDLLSEHELEEFRQTGRLPDGVSFEDLDRPAN